MNLRSTALAVGTLSRAFRSLAFTGAAAVVLNFAPAIVQAATTASFTDAYSGGSDASCSESYQLVGAEPTDGLKHPVFVYTVGTWETYNNASAMAAINGMAARGFVAASIEYPNTTFGDCTKISARANCIYNPNHTTSAIAALCARSTADCSKGIVTGGFSQGSIIATLAKNFNPGVKAAYGMGDGLLYTDYSLRRCMKAGKYDLPVDRLRVVNGEHDNFLGPTTKGAYAQTRAVTGMNCPDGTEACFRLNGSGWYVVQNSEVQDHWADHCYMRRAGCLTSENELDQGWLTGSDAWELNANLDWLAGFAAQ